jgi:tryptophan synthase beta chain
METFSAGLQFARTEGILPAPEANHAVAETIRQALRCKEEGKSEAILFNLCGHGHFDIQAYIDYHSGKLEAYEYPQEEIAMALSGLPSIE